MTSIFVSGAGSYVGLHIVARLLRDGHAVRGSVRDPSRAPKLKDALARNGIDVARLDFVALDLTKDDGWNEALAGIERAVHCASPFPGKPPKDENDVIVPARDGTLRMLRAAQAAGLKRVVLTSSAAAVASGHPQRTTPFTEADWSLLPTSDKYSKSKTIAEQAAWEWHAAQKGLEVVAVNPPFVFGPMIDGHDSASLGWILQLMRREAPGLPDLCVPMVDVRDVADAHARALFAVGVDGKRFITCAASLPFWKLAEILAAQTQDLGLKIPTMRVPNIVLKVVALWDSQVRIFVPALGRTIEYDSNAARGALQFAPRAIEETIRDTATSARRFGLA